MKRSENRKSTGSLMFSKFCYFFYTVFEIKNIDADDDVNYWPVEICFKIIDYIK